MTDPAVSTAAPSTPPDFEQEMAGTRRVLERLPEDRLDWRPHVKSFSVGELGLHLANLVGWMQTILTTDELDVAKTPRATGPFTVAEILEAFDASAAAVRDTLSTASAQALTSPWTLRSGGHVIFRLPKAAVLRTMGINHIVHHRGQLTVYLRLLDVSVPGLYGPSADER